jgi:hypothetical protein
MTMRVPIAFAMLCVLGGQVTAQPDLQTTLLGVYRQTLGGMQKATTAGEIERIVNAIDTPDWLSVSADGTRLTRDQSKQELVRSLAGPKGDQPTIDLLWLSQSDKAATAVCWVFGKSNSVDAAGQFGPKGARHELLTGALVRDTWILTKDGWRRRMHEKIFPNRVLAVDGKSVVFPRPPQ